MFWTNSNRAKRKETFPLDPTLPSLSHIDSVELGHRRLEQLSPSHPTSAMNRRSAFVQDATLSDSGPDEDSLYYRPGPSRQTKKASVPNWGPPIESNHIASDGHLRSDRIDSMSSYDTSPGIGRGAGPMSHSPSRELFTYKRSPQQGRAQGNRKQPVSMRAARASSGSASMSEESSSEEELDSPARRLPFRSPQSTGNHRALAGGSVTLEKPRHRRNPPTLPPDALDRLDRLDVHGATSASETEQRQSHKTKSQRPPRAAKVDEFEPTYNIAPATRLPRATASSPHMPSRAKEPTTRRTKPTHPASPSPLRNGRTSPTRPTEGADDNEGSKGTRDSSAETLVDEQRGYNVNTGGYPKLNQRSNAAANRLVLPSGMPMGPGALNGLLLPDDVTGMTSALLSPVKARLGVKHAPLHPLVGQAQGGDRKARFKEIKNFVLGLEEELETAKGRLQVVEVSQSELRGDVRKIEERVEVSDYKRGGPSSHRGPREDAEAAGYSTRIASMSAHIAALGEDLQRYRSAVGDIQTAMGHHQGASRAPHIFKSAKSAAQRQVDEEYLQLQDQVQRLEEEVCRLQSIVEEGERQPRHRRRSSQQDERLDEYPAPRRASSPTRHSSNIPSHRQPSTQKQPQATSSRKLSFAPEPAQRGSSRHSKSHRNAARSDEVDDGPQSEPDYPRSSTLPYRSARYEQDQRREISDEEDDGEETETPRPSSSSGHHQRQSRKSRDHEEDDLTTVQARVDQTLQKVYVPSNERAASSATRAAHPADLVHDPATCTVCVSLHRKEKRRDSRRARVLANVRRQDSHHNSSALEEDLFLSLLDSSTHHRDVKLSTHQASLLERLIKEHLDEFLHARMLYSELADELKLLNPMEETTEEDNDDAMTAEKRKILVEHVLESVEDLEIRCTRIQGLRRLLAVAQGNGRAASPPGQDGGASRASKSTSKTSADRPSSSGNPLLPRRKATAAGPTTLSRAMANSPPLNDGASSRGSSRRNV